MESLPMMLSADDGKNRQSRPARSYDKNIDIQSSNQLMCVLNKQVQYISVCKEQCCRIAAVYINVQNIFNLQSYTYSIIPGNRLVHYENISSFYAKLYV